MAILALDSCIQTTGATWTTASDSQTWALVLGAGTYAIAGNFYQLSTNGSPTGSVIGNLGTVTGTNVATMRWLGSKTTANFEQLIRLSITKNTGTTVALVGRATGTTTYYRCRVHTTTLDIHNVTGGTTALIGTSTLPFTLTLGQSYYMRFRVTGTSTVTLSANVWPDDGTTIEPLTWTIPATVDPGGGSNPPITAAGRFGTYVLPTGSTEVVNFDSYSVTDSVTPNSVVNDSPYGFTFFVDGSEPKGWDSGCITYSPPQNLTTQLFTDLAELQGTSPTIWLRYQFRGVKFQCNPPSAVVEPPTDIPLYDTTSLAVMDNAVAQCNANGVNILIPIQDLPNNCQIYLDNGTLASNNGSYCGNGPGTSPPTPQANGFVAAPQSYKRFAQFLANRYNGFTGHGTAQSFQIGNEEFDTFNARTGLALPPTVIACYPAIKAIYPGVLTGQCAVRKTSNQAQTHITNWCKTVFGVNGGSPVGIAQYSDYADAHYYRDGNCTPDPNVTCTDSSLVPSAPLEITLISNVLASAVNPNRPIYFMETGWGVGIIVNDPSQVNTTLNAAINSVTLGTGGGLTSGNPYTSLTITALQVAANSGDTYEIDSGSHTQTVTLSGSASLGATTLNVNSFTANFSYPVGSTVNAMAFTVTTGGGSAFPSSNFLVLIDNEALNISSRSGATFTVATGGRGYGTGNGATSPASHASGAQVNLAITLTAAMQATYISEMYDAGRTSTNNQCQKVFVWTIDYTLNYQDNIGPSGQTTFETIENYIANHPTWGGGGGGGYTPKVGLTVITRDGRGLPIVLGRDGKSIIVTGRG